MVWEYRKTEEGKASQERLLRDDAWAGCWGWLGATQPRTEAGRERGCIWSLKRVSGDSTVYESQWGMRKGSESGSI